MRRRHTVGRAYDMAIEIAQALKDGSTVLDVGCGSGFIAHHLRALLNSTVIGLDVSPSVMAPISYLSYDGNHVPVQNGSFDAVLLCYVLHHAQDALLVLAEASRVLRADGRVIVYEDNPGSWWDRIICAAHNRQWESRTGRCSFRHVDGWLRVFELSGFKVVNQRKLSRWRNLAHPVARNFFVLTKNLPYEC